MNWRTLFHRARKEAPRDEQGRFVSEARRAIRAKAASMYRERGLTVPAVLEGGAS